MSVDGDKRKMNVDKAHRDNNKRKQTKKERTYMSVLAYSIEKDCLLFVICLTLAWGGVLILLPPQGWLIVRSRSKGTPLVQEGT